MKDKERLLDTHEPLRFIFSHSALREGWDNPNVFQICTLNETTSEIKKRQEIGRGLRLPVTEEGDRVRDENINVLTVIANESYEDFSRKLQTEIEEDTGVSFAGRIKNKEDRRRIKLTKNIELDESFKELWDKIRHRTKYSVEFSSESLVAEAARLLQDVVITKPRISSIKTRIVSMGNGMASDIKGNDYFKSNAEQLVHVPNVLDRIGRHTKLTRRTIFDVLDAAGMFDKIPINSEQVIDEVLKSINQALQKLMLDGIKYERTGQSWDMRLFDDRELNAYVDNLYETQRDEKTVYDYSIVDSDIERQFAHDLEANDSIKFYIKLPNWFTIDTPLGKYNPDWAVVFDGDERVYFVAETKGTNDLNDLHLGEGERGRIKAGRKHFETLGIPFVAPTDSVSETLSQL